MGAAPEVSFYIIREVRNVVAEPVGTLTNVLQQQAIVAHFQPIFSVAKQRAVGLEALSRGYNPRTGELIAPLTLFEQATDKKSRVTLDRLCREKALQAYAGVRKPAQPPLLFLNLDTSIIDCGVVGSGHLLTAAKKQQLSPHSIVIEIVESPVCDITALSRFIESYRAYGFLIAIDDVGSAFSNFDRILQLRPDIIKIDRSLVQHIHLDYYKQALFSALTDCAKRIGALVVAEGVETEMEAITALRLGTDFLQGYYLQPPAPPEAAINEKQAPLLQRLALSLRTEKLNAFSAHKKSRDDTDNLLQTVVSALSGTPAGQFSQLLPALLELAPTMQCLYILDGNGLQVTDTVSAPAKQCTNNALFTADCLGADQSLKDYYLRIQAGFTSYRSRPYRSLANGSPCVTYAAVFPDDQNNSFIICLDIDPET